MRYKKHRTIWENHWGQKIPAGHHIHHIDGNKLNNDISNLLCVSILEHAMIHYLQGDVQAYNILALQIRRPSKKLTLDERKKISESKKGSTPWNKGLTNTCQKGSAKSEEMKRKNSIAQKKNWRDPEVKERRSASMRGKRKVVECPHCGVKGGGGNMRRYHFDNCTNN